MGEFKLAVPLLRIFDEAKAREFYLDFLGFTVDFEHRFAADLPLYMGIGKDAVKLHLSEHFGDGAPGVAIRLEMTGLEEFARQLLAKKYKHARPGLPDEQPWGWRELRISDPFGNKLVFCERFA